MADFKGLSVWKSGLLERWQGMKISISAAIIAAAASLGTAQVSFTTIGPGSGAEPNLADILNGVLGTSLTLADLNSPGAGNVINAPGLGVGLELVRIADFVGGTIGANTSIASGVANDFSAVTDQRFMDTTAVGFIAAIFSSLGQGLRGDTNATPGNDPSGGEVEIIALQSSNVIVPFVPTPFGPFDFSTAFSGSAFALERFGGGGGVDSSLVGANGVDNLVTFFLDLNSNGVNDFGDTFIFAFEDAFNAGVNFDYQDLVIVLQNAIPTPGAAAMLGLAGLVAGRRRR